MHLCCEEAHQLDQVYRSQWRLQVKRFSSKASFKLIWLILS